jgi:hypothetical protein
MIDVNHHISPVERTVGDRVLEAGTARVLTTSQSFAATLEELRDACTRCTRTREGHHGQGRLAGPRALRRLTRAAARSPRTATVRR